MKTKSNDKSWQKRKNNVILLFIDRLSWFLVQMKGFEVPEAVEVEFLSFLQRGHS